MVHLHSENHSIHSHFLSFLFVLSKFLFSEIENPVFNAVSVRDSGLSAFSGQNFFLFLQTHDEVADSALTDQRRIVIDNE